MEGKIENVVINGQAVEVMNLVEDDPPKLSKVERARKSVRDYKRRNKEKIKEYNKKYYLEHHINVKHRDVVSLGIGEDVVEPPEWISFIVPPELII